MLLKIQSDPLSKTQDSLVMRIQDNLLLWIQAIPLLGIQITPFLKTGVDPILRNGVTSSMHIHWERWSVNYVYLLSLSFYCYEVSFSQSHYKVVNISLHSGDLTAWFIPLWIKIRVLSVQGCRTHSFLTNEFFIYIYIKRFRMQNFLPPVLAIRGANDVR